MNVKFIKNLINWCRKNPIKTIIIFILLILIGLLIFNISTERCWPPALGKTNRDCEIGTLIVRLGYAIGGMIALLVAVASFERVRALDKTADAQNQTAKAQNKTARAQEQGNIEDRYKNAITQFGNENSSVRLAGAYGLYHLAKDNKDRRENICDVLCVHIRDLTTSEVAIGKNSDGKEIKYSEKYKTKPSDEVQSILDLLVNKDKKKDFPFKSSWINLAYAYLNGADLAQAQLQEAKLNGAQLSANLSEAELQGSNLIRTHLKGSNLILAQLQGAKLFEAHLQGASLIRTHLEGSNLIQAQLQGANLREAQLQGANLMSAQLQGAHLDEAQLQGAYLRQAHLQGAYLYKAQLQGADLMTAELQGANLIQSQLQGAFLVNSHFQGADLRESKFQGANLSFARLQGVFQGVYIKNFLEKTDFRGTFTEDDAKKYDKFNMLDINNVVEIVIEPAILRLRSRINKKDSIKNVVFSGYITKKQLNDFQKITIKTTSKLVKIKDYDQLKFNYFKQRMQEVLSILGQNISNTPYFKFPKPPKPPKAAKLHKSRRGVYPEAEANEVIAILEDVKRKLERVKKRLEKQ